MSIDTRTCNLANIFELKSRKNHLFIGNFFRVPHLGLDWNQFIIELRGWQQLHDYVNNNL